MGWSYGSFSWVATSRRAQQSYETFLLEVPICGQSFQDTAFAHQQHRATIGETVALVRTSFVQCETACEGTPIHWRHGDLWIVHDRFDHLNRGGTDMKTVIG